MASTAPELTIDDLADRAKRELMSAARSALELDAAWDIITKVVQILPTDAMLELLKLHDPHGREAFSYELRAYAMVYYIGSNTTNVPSEEGLIVMLLAARIMALLVKDEEVTNFLKDLGLRFDNEGGLIDL